MKKKKKGREGGGGGAEGHDEATHADAVEEVKAFAAGIQGSSTMRVRTRRSRKSTERGEDSSELGRDSVLAVTGEYDVRGLVNMLLQYGVAHSEDVPSLFSHSCPFDNACVQSIDVTSNKHRIVTSASSSSSSSASSASVARTAPGPRAARRGGGGLHSEGGVKGVKGGSKTNTTQHTLQVRHRIVGWLSSRTRTSRERMYSV